MVKKCAFIFTNYNNSVLAEKMVESIAKNNLYYFLVDIIIVDNNSINSEKKILKNLSKRFSKILKIIYNKNNLGYFGGLNIGLGCIKCKEYSFIVIGNNDLIFNNNFIDSVFNSKYKDKYPIIAPDIIRLDGFHQNPHVINPPSRFREIIYDLYFMNYNLSKLISFLARVTNKFTRRGDEDNYNDPQEIIQGYGACYIITPIFFDYFKELWSPTFLMYEEFFLSLQLETQNLKIFYDPSIKVQHIDHSTVSKLPSKKMWQITKQSHLIYRKYVKL